MRGGEEVEGYLRGEDFLGKWRLEEGRKTFLENAESFAKFDCSLIVGRLI